MSICEAERSAWPVSRSPPPRQHRRGLAKSGCKTCTVNALRESRALSELPRIVVAYRLDGPGELVAERLGEELLDRNLELVREDDRETRVDVVLGGWVSLEPS